MEKNPKFAPAHSLIFLTNRVGRLLANRIRQSVDEDMEVIMPHMGVLVDLWMQDGVRQGELAVSVIKDKGTIARSIDILERESLVVRVPDEHDRRNKRIYLTHRGREMRCRLIPHAHAVLADATTGLSTEAIALCGEVLLHMLNRLNEEA